MKVSVVIINWNGEEKLKKFLPEILKVKGVSEFIVSDDASTDGSVKWVEENYPKIKIVKRQKNGGFSSNTNSGVKEAFGDLVFLLNADAVPDKDCVEKALPFFKDESVFSVGCNTGGNWSWAKFKDGFFWHYVSKGKIETHQTLWARGGSGIFRKDLYQELGGMDELFNPFYEEDTDLGYRATKRGYKNIWVKECVVKLPEEKGVIESNFSLKSFSQTAQRNQLLFIWKNITDSGMIREHKIAIVKQIFKNPGYIKVLIQALRVWSKVEDTREKERKSERLSDQSILMMYSD